MVAKTTTKCHPREQVKKKTEKNKNKKVKATAAKKPRNCRSMKGKQTSKTK